MWVEENPFTPEQAGALPEILAKIASLPEGVPAAEGGRGKWLHRAFVPNEGEESPVRRHPCLMRYVKGHFADGGVDLVWEKLQATAKWREEFGVDKLRESFGATQVAASTPFSLLERDAVLLLTLRCSPRPAPTTHQAAGGVGPKALARGKHRSFCRELVHTVHLVGEDRLSGAWARGGRR